MEHLKRSCALSVYYIETGKNAASITAQLKSYCYTVTVVRARELSQEVTFSLMLGIRDLVTNIRAKNKNE